MKPILPIQLVVANSSVLTADLINEIIDKVNKIDKLELMIEYLFAKETNPERAAEIIAQIYGNQ